MVVRVLCSFTANSIGVGWQHRQAWAEHYERGSSHGYDGVGRGSHGRCGVVCSLVSVVANGCSRSRSTSRGRGRNRCADVVVGPCVLHNAGVCCT